jgi:DNA helicase-2/ATP-dependent DNA helicase PcrA
MGLNAEQARAVRHRGSGLLVLAGAGSGKTRVITTRIKTLVDEGVPEDRILAVTFTNKAAREMRERLGKMGVSDDVWIGTFHATGVRVLRMFADQAGYGRNFTIYDGDAQKALVKALLADVRGGEKLADGLVLHYISQLKGQDRGPEFVEHSDSIVPRPMRRAVREVYERYEEALRRSNAMDFADLLLNTVRLLRGARGTPAERMLTKFQHVLVDEFQDTNAIQMEMADLFATRGTLCVVGDDDQSIYGWRGADPDGMMRFARRPGVEIVKLEENYRCAAPILDCANAVIARNSKRLGKTLRANKQGELVRVHLLSSEREEARQVALSIRKPYGEHAVLYRTHAQSRPIEEALRREAIPYTIVGGLRFYDRAEVKDVLAYFRLAVNPKADVDLLRVANKPARGMGAKKMGALKTAAAKKGVTMYEALKESSEEKAQGLHGVLRDLAGARHSSLGLLEFFDKVMRITGYKAALVRTAKESKSQAQKEKAQGQIENVNELASDVATFAEDNPGATVEDYVEHVSLVSSFDKESGPSVSLMTIHASKGLEFEHVHLVGFEEGLLPHGNVVKEAKEKRDPSLVEEERRLAYVAITRAKDKLDITMARMRTKAGKMDRTTPSRFFDELPEGRYRRLGFKDDR